MKEHWPAIASGAVTAVACFLIGLAEPPAVFSHAVPREPMQKQSQVQFIVVPIPPTEAELHDQRVRDRLAMQQRGE
jgi:hypothetical protein